MSQYTQPTCRCGAQFETEADLDDHVAYASSVLNQDDHHPA